MKRMAREEAERKYNLIFWMSETEARQQRLGKKNRWKVGLDIYIYICVCVCVWMEVYCLICFDKSISI